ncbi:hypothetical protein Vadar_008832 [Vaccinium darrowii]|uniref:Uncharacterized protein n=1 Tax=Vaccinium darrowii TaxID=229202 RepID=A0ACB7YLH3_9ERIC|nr:hypothetical protein Vadar_008832 [Vaccinium darrowii]
MSGSPLLLMAILHLLLLLTPPTTTITGVATATRLLGSKPEDYVAFKPIGSPGQPEYFGSGSNIKSCLPKGFRHSSAPSRYINYHTYGSTLCSSGDQENPTP